MVAYTGAMHVARNKRGYVAKSGEQRVYESVLLRRTYRDGTAVRHETLANLSKLPPEAVEAIEATLKGQTLIPAGSEFTITRSLPHGHAAAVAAMAHRLGFPALLGPPCRSRDLVFALIISRVIRPASKLSTLLAWPDTTLGVDLVSSTRPPTRSTRRWTGWLSARMRSRRNWWPNTLGRMRTHTGWRYST